jgi:hypothetical protein
VLCEHEEVVCCIGTEGGTWTALSAPRCTEKNHDDSCRDGLCSLRRTMYERFPRTVFKDLVCFLLSKDRKRVCATRKRRFQNNVCKGVDGILQTYEYPSNRELYPSIDEYIPQTDEYTPQTDNYTPQTLSTSLKSMIMDPSLSSCSQT